jgi:predicted nucleotidyltransferase
MSPCVQLSAEQVTTIRQWAESTPQIGEVWLYGSRAKGAARADSDVDLAVVIASTEQRVGDYSSGVYMSYRREWQQRLVELLGLPAHVELKDGETDVTAWAEEQGVRLYP